MTSDKQTDEFIRSTFRSIWSLEVLLYLREHSERAWSGREIEEALRASELIVTQCLDSLIAAGLVSIDADGCATFAPASPDLVLRFEETRERYRRAPDAVRRLIISSASTGLTAFADAFKFRKD